MDEWVSTSVALRVCSFLFLRVPNFSPDWMNEWMNGWTRLDMDERMNGYEWMDGCEWMTERMKNESVPPDLIWLNVFASPKFSTTFGMNVASPKLCFNRLDMNPQSLAAPMTIRVDAVASCAPADTWQRGCERAVCTCCSSVVHCSQSWCEVVRFVEKIGFDQPRISHWNLRKVPLRFNNDINT